MNDLVLKSCRFVDKSSPHYIAINNGKIAEISKQPLKGDDEIDINENFLLPGLIDPHVHFRDPGLTYKESFKTGSQAAAHGGFTCVLDMPNTIPPTNTAKAFKEKIKIGENKSIVNFGLHGGLNNLEDLEKIAKLKPASFKIFMDLLEDEEIEEIFKNMSYMSEKLENPIPFTLHCENKRIIEENTDRIKKVDDDSGENTAIDYSYARPSEAELVSVVYAVSLAKKYNLPIHICHLSAKESLKYLKSIKNESKNENKRENKNKNISENKSENKSENMGENINVSTEIAPHHLLLDNSAFNKLGNIVKTNPPLRPKGENLTIAELKNITMIGTDHAPHSLEEKQKGVWETSPGIPGLETVLPLLLSEVNKGNIDLKTIAKLMSENPAKRFSMENKGKIKVGYDADLVVIDLKKEGKFDIDTFYTKAEYSPFDNRPYKGIATMTIINGNIVMNDGIVVDNVDNGKYVYY